LWGSEACEPIITDYKGAATPTDYFTSAELLDFDADDSMTCFETNDAGMPEITGAINCVAMPVENNLWQYVDKSTVTCINPIDNNLYTGVESCVRGGDNEWVYAGAYVSQD